MSSRPQGKNLTLKRGTRYFVPQYDKEDNIIQTASYTCFCRSNSISSYVEIASRHSSGINIDDCVWAL